MLKLKLENLDGLDDAVAKLYKKDGDGFALQVEGGGEGGAEVAKLKQELVEAQSDLAAEKKAAADARGEAERRRKTNDRLTADLEAAKAGKGGDGAEAERLKAEHAAALEAKDAEISELKTGINGLHMQTADSQCGSALIAAGFSEQIATDIRAGAKNRYKVDDAGKVSIFTADGKPMAGSGENGLATFDDLAKELAAAKPDFLTDTGKGGGGKPPSAASNGGNQKTITRTEYNAIPIQERAAAVKDGVTVVDG